MKKIFTTLFVFATGAVAQPAVTVPKQVVCVPLAQLVETLSDPEIGEKPVWIGKESGAKTTYSLWQNTKTGAWTLVQSTPTTGCVLGVGPQGEFFLGTPL